MKRKDQVMGRTVKALKKSSRENFKLPKAQILSPNKKKQEEVYEDHFDYDDVYDTDTTDSEE